MKATFESLKEYQDILLRIAELDRLLSFVPDEIKNLENEWVSIKEKIKELNERNEQQETELKSKNLLLDEANTKAEKFEKDLHEVTNNKEYHAVLKEIDTAKKQIHTLNEDISQRMVDREELNNNVEECTQLEVESKSRFEKAMSEYKESMKENSAERSKKLVVRDKLAENIPQKLLKQFHRIADRRNGVGLAVCVNSVCTACNVRVRQSIVDQLRKSDRLIFCESCKRILLYDDMAEA